jgi:hypothetical protein
MEKREEGDLPVMETTKNFRPSALEAGRRMETILSSPIPPFPSLRPPIYKMETKSNQGAPVCV